ncbi:MAG: HAD-IB family hydrolase, partial [Betaproteobacteria bacterium]|nr:HAD-IB family hydrolase [Betaproteobacteria bacterium]
GIASFREGKVTRLMQWIKEQACDAAPVLRAATFYSDSFNDIPLLELVGFPVATNPDARLRAHALAKAWPCLALFGEHQPGAQ